MSRGYRRAGVRRGRPPARSRRRRPPRRRRGPRGVACRGGIPTQRPAHHRRPVAGRLPRCRRSSRRADAEPRPPRRRRACCSGRHYAQAAPCGPSRASLHTGQYLMKHRSGAQRHAARRPVHEPRARGACRRATTRCCSVTPTPRPIRARSAHRRSAACGPTRACSPATARSSTCRSTCARGASGCAPVATTSPTTSARMYEPVSDAPGAPVAYAAEHTEAAFLTGAVLDHVDATTEPVVRARGLHPPAPAVRRARSRTPRCTTRRRSPTPSAPQTYEAEGAVHPVLAGAVAHPRHPPR